MRVYYKFSYRGLDKIPYGKPIILAPNHTNAFVDPVTVGMITCQRVRFFARGDVFKGAAAKWVLNSMSVSPMYRIQEGYSELKKNDKTFEECRQLLSENKTILLFPEAICIQEKRLRPLKKGLARIAFQSLESFNDDEDIFIVPIGLNYSDAKRFRSKLFIDFGDAVSVKEYKERYEEDKVKAINEFTKMLEAKMAKHLVIIKNKENDNLVSEIEEIYLDQWLREKNQDTKSLEFQFEASKEIAEMINKLEEQNEDVIILLREKVLNYAEKLKSKKLRDHLLRPENIDKMNVGTFLLEYIIIYFGSPIYFLCLLFNYPPFFLSKKYANKKVKHVEFFASIYANMSMFIWSLLYIVGMLVVALAFRNWLFLGIYIIALPLSGRFALRFYPRMKKIVGRWRLLRMVRKDRDTVQELANMRAEIVQNITTAKEIYLTSLK